MLFQEHLEYYKIEKNQLKEDSRPKSLFKKWYDNSCYGFKVDWNYGILKIPLGGKRYFDIKLNNFVLKKISTLKVHSFSISSLGKLSISYSKPITEQIECASIVGLDRNLSNVTVGNIEKNNKIWSTKMQWNNW